MPPTEKGSTPHCDFLGYPEKRADPLAHSRAESHRVAMAAPVFQLGEDAPPRIEDILAMGKERILVCDHRGLGLEREVEFLRDLGFQVERSGTLRQTLLRLGQTAPDLVVVDLLSREGGAELGALDRARGETPPVPLLILAEPGDDEAMLRTARSIRGEGWDVARRQAPREELRIRIQRLLSEASRFGEMVELRHQATHDDRTDLLRPKTFQLRLFEHFSAAQRHKLELALVLIDLDRFGSINKQYDHTVGDAIITRVGEAIRKAIRTEDCAGRLGGDEFGILLPYTGKLDAAQVVKRLREAISAVSGRHGNAMDSIRVSGSLGFETFDGSDIDSVETLRRHAERALRHAKRDGGDQALYYRNLPSEPG